MSGMLVDTHRHAWWQRRILAARVRALVPRREPGASAMQKTCGGPEVAGWQLQKALPQRPMLPNALTGGFVFFKKINVTTGSRSLQELDNQFM